MEDLKQYLEKLQTSLGPAVIKAVTGTLDAEAEKVLESIKERTPVSAKDHKHLVESLQKIPVNTFGKYGWIISFEGYNEYGVAYSLIARALNRGTATREGLHHVDYAFSQLKGLDERLVGAVEEEINKIK